MQFLTKMTLSLAFGGMLALSGCGNGETSTQTSSATSSASNGASPSGKVLTVAVNANMMPFSYVDDKGHAVGFDVDVMNQVAKNQGYQVEYKILPWQQMFTSVENGESDVAISGISYNDNRASKYSLSDPYAYVPMAVLYFDGKATVNKFEDIKGLRLGVQRGGTYEALAHEQNIAQTVSSDTVFLGFQKMVKGDVDVLMSDKQILQNIANNYPEHHAKVVEYGDPSDKNSYVVVIGNSQKSDVIQEINQGIKQLKDSGELAKLEQKWFEGKVS